MEVNGFNIKFFTLCAGVSYCQAPASAQMASSSCAYLGTAQPQLVLTFVNTYGWRKAGNKTNLSQLELELGNSTKGGGGAVRSNFPLKKIHTKNVGLKH